MQISRFGPGWFRFFAGLLLVALNAWAAPAYGDVVRFGVLTPLDRTGWRDVRAAWARVETLGFDSAWVNDHLLAAPPPESDPHLEAWTTVSALAALTPRVEVGVLVSGNTYRNPALLAKMATTVDHVSGGRLALGMGAAWFEREHEAYGFEFGTTKERARRLAEALEVVTTLWSGGGSFSGRYYALDDAPFAPTNIRKPRPPLIIGGQGKQWIVPLVGRFADGWNAAPGVTPAGFRERVAIIEKACSAAHRTDCPTRFSTVQRLDAITDEPVAAPAAGSPRSTWALRGTPDQIAARIREFTDAGANEVIVMLPVPYDLALLQRFAEEVVPRVRGTGAD